MKTGYNHNFTYRKLKLHIQTEDCGVKKPRIETHLFRDGIIVATRKTSYDDILKVDDLGKVVEELMKDQHREMLRRLKKGEYDKVLGVVADKKQVEMEAALEGLPEEMELDELAVEALAVGAEPLGVKSAETEVLPEEKAATAKKEKKTVEAVKPKEEPPNLEELVLKYFLGESGRGLKEKAF
jgi:hypothetical protein